MVINPTLNHPLITSSVTEEIFQNAPAPGLYRWDMGGSHGFHDTAAAGIDLCMIAWPEVDCPLSGCQTNSAETKIVLLRK